MNKIITEQETFQRQQEELFQLENKLAAYELKFATLNTHLEYFRAEVFRVVGSLYVELDTLKVEIAEYSALLHPDILELRKEAKIIKNEATAFQAIQNNYQIKQEFYGSFQPSEQFQQLYLRIIKIVHPELTTDAQERQFRREIITEINQIYQRGDEEQMKELFKAILEFADFQKEIISEANLPSHLVKINQQIVGIKQRIDEVKKQLHALKTSSLAILRYDSIKLAQQGKDLLAETAAELKQEITRQKAYLNELISQAKSRLENLIVIGY